MIDLTSYWCDRDSRYRSECTEEIQRNALKTITKVNLALALAAKDGIIRDQVSSGWRPQGINDSTKNSAKNSNHLKALACDIEDKDRSLAQWCISNPDKLNKIGLWIEDPRWTPTWVHFQIVPPKSMKLVYIPNTNPPISEALIGQKPLPIRTKI